MVNPQDLLPETAEEFNLLHQVGPRSPDNGFKAISRRDAIILIIIAALGILGNVGLICAVMVIRHLRRAANAFLFHQCLLDLVKSIYCLPFAQSMLSRRPPSYCNVLSASYIVLVTTSAFNLLVLVMNETYQFSDLILGLKDSRNGHCIVFGIFIVWFGSIIMNLGVAFIPGNPSYDQRIGECIYVYGITRNYVLHLLWIVLITMALGMTCMYLHKLHVDIRRSSYYRLATLIRTTMMIDTSTTDTSPTVRRNSAMKEKYHFKQIERMTYRKLVLLIFLTLLFVLFWYPLFVLTAVDTKFQAPPWIYTVLAMAAWSHPAATPLFLVCLTKTRCCCCHGNRSHDRRRQPSATAAEVTPSLPPAIRPERHLTDHTLMASPCHFGGDSMQEQGSFGYYTDDIEMMAGTSNREALLRTNPGVETISVQTYYT